MDIIERKVEELYTPSPIFTKYFGQSTIGIFDIETTGLSPANCKIILGGLITHKENQATMTQVFADRLSEEKHLLEAIWQLLSPLDIVITYNGQGFDIPFFQTRMRKNNLACGHMPYHLDIYRLVKYFSPISQFTPNLKQKTLEDFMGLWSDRSDLISGKESVELYYNYLAYGEKQVKDQILLHNGDDVLQLYRLLKVLPKVDMDRAMYRLGFPFRTNSFLYIVDKINITNDALIIKGRQGPDPLNCIYYGDQTYSYQFNKKGFKITVPILGYKGLTLVDVESLEEGLTDYENGYLVLCKGKETNYSHINLFAKQLLERITNKWTTEN